MSARETDRRRAAPAWITATIAGIFGLFYAYAVWAGLANLLAMNSLATNVLGGSLQPTAWIALVLAMVLPVIIFVIAVVTGGRRAVWKLAVLLAVGLSIVGAYWINVQALFTHAAVVFQ